MVTLAIGMRALIPAGYMPDLGALAQGKIEMVVCTMNGPVKMLVDGEHDPQPTKHAETQSDICPFAIVAPWVAAATFDAADLLYALAVVTVIIFTTASVHAGRRQAYSLAQPRGPPVFSL